MNIKKNCCLLLYYTQNTGATKHNTSKAYNSMVPENRHIYCE